MVKRKEAGVQTPPLHEETPLKIPGFPEPRNLFHFSRREEAPDLRPNVPWSFSLLRQRSGLLPFPANSARLHPST